MDGWETRRRRTPGHDWCVLQLGLRGRIHGVDVDTSHFVGNQPEQASLEACDLPGQPTREALERAQWLEVLPPSPLAPGASNLFPLDGRRALHPRAPQHLSRTAASRACACTARWRWTWRAAAAGASSISRRSRTAGSCSAPATCTSARRSNLILPGRAKSMGDGWETRRRRARPGPRLGRSCKLGAAGASREGRDRHRPLQGQLPRERLARGLPRATRVARRAGRARRWQELLPRTQAPARTRGTSSREELRARGPFTHVRLRIYPDGGVSRLRIHGRVDAP